MFDENSNPSQRRGIHSRRRTPENEGLAPRTGHGGSRTENVLPESRHTRRLTTSFPSKQSRPASTTTPVECAWAGRHNRGASVNAAEEDAPLRFRTCSIDQRCWQHGALVLAFATLRARALHICYSRQTLLLGRQEAAPDNVEAGAGPVSMPPLSSAQRPWQHLSECNSASCITAGACGGFAATKGLKGSPSAAPLQRPRRMPCLAISRRLA